jgi:tetratricopeptide (TPR) repeat protein
VTRVLAALALAALALAVFSQVREHEFVSYDDPIYVLENPNLREALDSGALWRAFRAPYETNWIPLTWLSLHVDYKLYGEAPAGYLLTNLALHLASTLLLFAALARMTRATSCSAFVAAVFAIHPLHVESVAWVSERKDVLAGFFWMLTLIAYARYAAAPCARRFAWVALALVLGLLAKPLAVTLPVVLLLLDYWPLDRLRGDSTRARPDGALLRRALLEKLPLFAIAAAAAVITFAVQRSLGAMDHGDALPFSVRLANASIAYVAYLRDSLWPSGLAVFYPHLLGDTSRGLALASAFVLVALSAAALRLAARHPYLLVGWLWYLVTLLPMIGLVQVGMQARADRYMYVPLIGVAIALAWGAAALAARAPRVRRAVAAAGIAALLALAVTAHRQVGTWRNSTALFRHALDVTRDNFVAQEGLARERLRGGALEEAEQRYREALRIKPRWAEAHFGLARTLVAQGQTAAAAQRYALGLRLAPDKATAHARLGFALLELGRQQDAEASLQRARALGLDSAELHAALGTTAQQRGAAREAADHYRAALARAPDHVYAGNNLAWLLASCEDRALCAPAEAVRLAERAVRASDAQNPSVLDTLAVAQAAAADPAAAARSAERALELAEAQENEALAARLRRRIPEYRRAADEIR